MVRADDKNGSRGKIARDEYIKSNMGLVHSCASRFRGRGIEYDDLFSAGCMGLVKAVDGFDAGRGLKFSTYAVPVILGEMRRLFRDGGTVKISRSLKELSLKVMRCREAFMLENYREPTVLELAEKLGVTPEEAVEALGAAMPPISLTEDPDEGGGQIDVPVDALDENLTDMISLKEIIGKLEANDRKLIILRYFRNKTQVETAKELSMTQVQVSRREKKILSSMREKLS